MCDNMTSTHVNTHNSLSIQLSLCRLPWPAEPSSPPKTQRLPLLSREPRRGKPPKGGGNLALSTPKPFVSHSTDRVRVQRRNARWRVSGGFRFATDVADAREILQGLGDSADPSGWRAPGRRALCRRLAEAPRATRCRVGGLGLGGDTEDVGGAWGGVGGVRDWWKIIGWCQGSAHSIRRWRSWHRQISYPDAPNSPR